MSLIADDVMNFTSALKMSYNFMAGREFLKKKKFKEKKKLISVCLPFSDLAYAAGAVPVFPIRMHVFDVNRYLVAMNAATSFLGWSAVIKFINFMKTFDSLKITENVMQEVVSSVNYKYNDMVEYGEKAGLSPDFCYGLKALWGMHVTKGHNLDATLAYTIRCSAWNKYLEALKTIVPKQVWIEIPIRNIGNALELLKENISNAITKLEDITGNHVSDNSLTKQFRIRNQISRYYKTIIYDIGTSDFYPCNPATFSEIISMLSISFQDYNSDVLRYLENISQLVREMKERIRKGIGMDVSKMPKIFFTPMFGGWDPEIHDIIYRMKGRVLYADWDVLRYLDEIDISGDPIEGYAKFLLTTSTLGFGCDNETITNSYLRVAKKIKADGVIFNQLFGCHSITNCYPMFREKIRRSLEIPIVMVNFTKIGEGTKQLETRLGAFMEMFKNNVQNHNLS